MSNKLLYDEAPLCVSPTLACVFGLNESIVIQQVHYLIEINRKAGRNYIDGRYWTYNSYSDWKRECFPFWSDSTIKRTFKSLERSGLLITGHYSRNPRDQRTWYSINYEVYEQKITDYQKRQDESLPEEVKNVDPMVNLTTPYGQNDPMYNIYNIYSDYTKTSTQTSLNGLNGAKHEKRVIAHSGKRAFDKEILRKQIIGICNQLGIDDVERVNNVYETILYYYRLYHWMLEEEHPRLNGKTMTNVVRSLLETLMVYEPDELEELIDQHFHTQYGMDIDYNIAHFVSDEILQNRSYEVFGV